MDAIRLPSYVNLFFCFSFCLFVLSDGGNMLFLISFLAVSRFRLVLSCLDKKKTSLPESAGENLLLTFFLKYCSALLDISFAVHDIILRNPLKK